ncbi:unnamed protein product [Moneuplotes crassus]|uniref:DUSP domain-containing protein n=1 Tax=Euplotes crassus TaxID=5936 RepID=A0AAD1X9N5_EUPCR|nr:unnamed protein product [Moneuplotes crassus]
MTEVMIRSIIKGCMAEYTTQIKDIERRILRLEGRTTLKNPKQASSIINNKAQIGIKRGLTTVRSKARSFASIKRKTSSKKQPKTIAVSPPKPKIDTDAYLSPLKPPIAKIEKLLKKKEIIASGNKDAIPSGMKLQKLPCARTDSSVKPMPSQRETMGTNQVVLSQDEEIEEEKGFCELRSPIEKKTELCKLNSKSITIEAPKEKARPPQRTKNHFDGSSASDSDPDTFHCQCVYDNRTNTVSNSFMEMRESKEPCSKFCKYLSPDEEKRLILKSTDSIDEFSHDSKQDDDQYAVSSKWWQGWCKYIGVDVKSLDDLKLKTLNSRPFRKMTQKLSDDDFEMIHFDETPPKFSQTRKAMHQRSSSVSGQKQQKSGSRTSRSIKRNLISFEMLKYKPGKIFNHSLLYFDNNSNMKLKDDLTEGQDYYLVDSKTWQYLSKWYGCDIEAKYQDTYESEGESTDNSQESEENEGESEENEVDTEENQPNSGSYKSSREPYSDENDESFSRSNSGSASASESADASQYSNSS